MEYLKICIILEYILIIFNIIQKNINYINFVLDINDKIPILTLKKLKKGCLMPQNWQKLTDLAGNRDFLVERVRLEDSDIAIEGSFELPPLAKLSMEDQIFVTAFIQSDGSIKETERLFGVSYPTIKSRLKRIAEQLEFVQLDAAPSRSDILNRLEKGEISVEEALEMLK